MDLFIAQLKQRLKEALPGVEAQAHMSPMRLEDERFEQAPLKRARQGAVLLLLYPHEHRLYMPLMQRPEYNGHHSGQISFPGGKQEPEDENKIRTALREAHEEMGILPHQVELLGTLSELYIPPSNYLVLPVVGWVKQRPHFIPDPVEVANIIEAPLDLLLDSKTIQHTYQNLASGMRVKIPYFNVEEQVVWGATAMILSEFLAVVRELD
ncbi:NUDIX hydrolase [Nafulsella turpanensis]|uniref:NUDIX hydrolase n=1 Tax=Nafulsella turpanensis TaxID=1265690 RepID=UPI00047698C6|nr:CoA pyrophosphatase [Nafulsella turpanensis]